MGPTILLIDVMAEAFRAFHALPKTITASDGQVINALLGFHSSVKDLLRRFRPSHVAAAWSCGTTFRKSILPEYKAHRTIPELLRTQKSLIDAYLSRIGISQFSVSGYEADDVLASIVTILQPYTGNVIVDTIDKDLLPLCCEGVKIWNFRTKTVWDDSTVKTRFGVSSRLLTDLLMMIGDKTDGVPGIKGLGLARAAELLNRFGGLHALCARHSELDQATQRRLEEALPLLKTNELVIPLVRNLPVELTLDNLALTDRVGSALEEASASLRSKDISFLYSEYHVTQHSLLF